MENTKDVSVLNNDSWIEFFNKFCPVPVEGEELDLKRRFDIHRYIFEPFEFNLKIIKDIPRDKVWTVVYINSLKKTRLMSAYYPYVKNDVDSRVIGYMVTVAKKVDLWRFDVNVDFSKLSFDRQLNMFDNDNRQKQT